jgi:hypothetical protein
MARNELSLIREAFFQKTLRLSQGCTCLPHFPKWRIGTKTLFRMIMIQSSL